MQDCAEEATESQLLPAGQPPVQPVGETVVLGAPPQLEHSSAQTRQVDRCQHHQGHRGEGDVDCFDGHFIEQTLVLCDEGLQDVTGEVVQVEDDKQGQGADDGQSPGRKQV